MKKYFGRNSYSVKSSKQKRTAPTQTETQQLVIKTGLKLLNRNYFSMKSKYIFVKWMTNLILFDGECNELQHIFKDCNKSTIFTVRKPSCKR